LRAGRTALRRPGTSKGVDVTVTFAPNGVDDAQYKTKLSLDLQSGGGPDVISMDGIWLGEFAQAGYIKPLDKVVGSGVDSWEGWSQISKAVQQAASFDGNRYGVPQGTDGRVLYYSKDLFTKAGLPTDWQPKSWDDILVAASALKKAGVPVPIQLDAGTAMGEATTMQGVLPLLVGTGTELYSNGKWMGASQGLRDALTLYKTIYVDQKLGDPILQQETAGRDKSFSEFAAGQVGILLESDYLWRSIVNPSGGTAPMANRDTVVGYVKIPAKTPGSGINGQDFVSMSGGAARVLNPNTKYPQQAWDLLTFINSKQSFENLVSSAPIITPRNDVNAAVLAKNPMLDYVATNVLPITAYRPGLAAYPEVSLALQDATAKIIAGSSVDDAVAAYKAAVIKAVGAANVAGN
jgi:multiple sugar transport system substrate-binding protein